MRSAGGKETFEFLEIDFAIMVAIDLLQQSLKRNSQGGSYLHVDSEFELLVDEPGEFFLGDVASAARASAESDEHLH